MRVQSNQAGLEDGVFYFLSDHRVFRQICLWVAQAKDGTLCSTSLTLDAEAGKVAELRYTAWGETRYTDGSTPTQRRYTGQLEAEAGLYFYQARWYDPYLNRWIQPDTIIPDTSNPLDWDRYSYVRNNPVRYTDRTGHCIDGVSTIACILGGAILLGAFTGYAVQVADNLESGLGWGEALTTDISGEKIAAGAVIAGGVVVGAVVVGTLAAASATALGLTGTAACADGDCTNEAQALGRLVQNQAKITKYNPGKGYNSFNAFKYEQGPAGPGMAWHHVVEQTPNNMNNFGPLAIHNTSNLIRLPSGAGLLHQRISGHYSSIQLWTTGSSTLTIRQWLQTKSFEVQWRYGIETINKFGGSDYMLK